MDAMTSLDTASFAGLPLHPLLVHAAVVLTPLTAIALIVCALWPAARRRVGAALPLAAVLVAVLIPLTAATGASLADAVGRAPAVQRHEALGLMLVPWAISLAPTALAVWIADRRRPDPSEESAAWPRPVRAAIAAAALVSAIGTLVLVILTGDAGARAVWEGSV